MVLSASLAVITGLIAAYLLWARAVRALVALVFALFGFCAAKTTMAPAIDSAIHSVTSFISSIAA